MPNSPPSCGQRPSSPAVRLAALRDFSPASRPPWTMSVSPPKADIGRGNGHVPLCANRDRSHRSKKASIRSPSSALAAQLPLCLCWRLSSLSPWPRSRFPIVVTIRWTSPAASSTGSRAVMVARLSFATSTASRQVWIFREHIQASIEDSDVLMVVVGPRWMGGSRHGHPRIHAETDYVRIEVEAALNRHIPVIPLLVGGADMPQPSQLPENIREFAYRNALQNASGRDFDHHMNGLIRATDKILLSAQTSAAAASADPGIDRRPSDSKAKTKHQTTPAGSAAQSSL